MNKEAIVLLSGGIDSTTTLVYALKHGYNIYALSFDYNQKNVIELEYAKKIAQYYNVKKHFILKINLSMSKSALIDKNIEVKKYDDNEKLPDYVTEVYVPARNIIFLSYALSIAENLSIYDIFIGANKDDQAGFPDCRPEFFDAFQLMANKGLAFTKQRKLKIHIPFIEKTKAEIIKYGLENGIDYSKTFSCYSPINGQPCNKCYACQVRNRAFEQLNIIK